MEPSFVLVFMCSLRSGLSDGEMIGSLARCFVPRVWSVSFFVECFVMFFLLDWVGLEDGGLLLLYGCRSFLRF